LDAAWERRNAVGAAPGFQLELADQMCIAGWLGTETFKGYYSYSGALRRKEQNPEMLRLLAVLREKRSVVASPLSDLTISDQLMLSLVNEGAALLEEGVALRASDIDVVCLAALGISREAGGPMFWADQRKVFEVVRRLNTLAKDHPDVWAVTPLLTRLSHERKRLSDVSVFNDQ